MGDQQDREGIKSMGWGERQYEPSRSGPSGPNSDRPIGTYWIIGATVALQAAVWAFLGPAHASSTNAWGALTNEVFLSGQVWRLFTYLILHGSGMHLFFNMLMVYVVGSFLEAQMGPVRLVRLYVIFGVIAALGYFVTASAWRGVPCIGASGAAIGFVVYFGSRFPHVKMMLWGIVPMSAWGLATLLVVMDLFGAMSSDGDGTAHTVHLGGALAGFATALALPRLSDVFEKRKVQKVHQQWVEHDRREAEDQKELDRLLAKIHEAGGIHALEESEREFLRAQSSKLKSRS